MLREHQAAQHSLASRRGARLRKMTDEELVRFAKAARFMCRDKSPRQVFVIQLEEARAE
jgi:hypothetical protein